MKEYIIVGDNNFWYASCLRSLKEVEEEIKRIKKHPEYYGNDDGYTPDRPNYLVVYEVEEIKEVEL